MGLAEGERRNKRAVCLVFFKKGGPRDRANCLCVFRGMGLKIEPIFVCFIK